MASTPTSSLLVQKQGASDNPGSWGDNLNVGLDILDAAVAGASSISTTGGTTTLADVDYTADAAKSMVLDVTGTLVSNATIVVPARNKIYAVRNGTSGAYTLTIKTSTGTGIAVPQSSSAFVVVDAAEDDVDFLTPPTTGTSGVLPITQGGSGATTAGDALTNFGLSANAQSLVTAANYAAMRTLLDLEVGTDFLSPAAIAAAYQPLDGDLTSWALITRASGFDTFGTTPSSANLAALVTDETGSGSLVFGTSPSLTTPDIGVASGTSLTLTSGTGLQVGASVPFSDTAGSLTLQNVDVLDATTEATIEAAIDTLGNLTSIQGVTFTFGAYAATLLNNANEAAFKAAVNLEAGVDYQAYDADLTTWASLTPSANAQSLVTAVDYAAMRALLDLEAGTDFLTPAAIAAAYQPLDADLTTIAGLSSADSNFIVGSATGWVVESGATVRTSLGVGTGDSPTFTAITVGNTGLTVGTSIPFSDAAGTLTLQNIDALDATTEATIEAAIDTLANLTSVQGRTVTLADAGANAVFGWDDTAGAYENLSAAEATAVLNVFGADAGAGGVKGLAPATVAGDATKFLRGDGTWTSIPGGGDALVANPLSQFAATTSLQFKGVISDETGSGAVVFADTPTLIAPLLGTPTSGVLTNMTGLPIASGVSGLGTGVATALAVNTGSAGAPVLFDGAGGTPSSLTLTNATGLPLAGVTDSTTEALGVGTLHVGHVSDTPVTRSAAGILAVDGTPLKKAGRETLAFPARAMIARTTNGAARGSVEMTTNKNMFATLDFDATTQEFVQFDVPFPKSWDLGTVTFQPVWSHASTTTNFGVVWQLAGVALSNDDAGDVAFGTAQTSTDTGGTTNDIYTGPESSAITIAGTPAAGDTVQFQLARVPANGSDTMAIDARLHGIRLFFTTNAATDL